MDRHLPEGGGSARGRRGFQCGPSEGAEAAEIVAQQVDNHDIFSAVFGVRLEPGGLGAVFGGGAAARGSAFHGTSGDAAERRTRFNAEKELGRKRQDALVWPGVKKRTVGGGLQTAQAAIERGGTAGGVDLDGNGEVELVDVAGANPCVDLLDASGVLLPGEVESALKLEIRAGWR